MSSIIIIVGIVFGVLNLILFFKIWGMTNNTLKIRLFLEAQRPDLEYGWGGKPRHEGYFKKNEEGFKAK